MSWLTLSLLVFFLIDQTNPFRINNHLKPIVKGIQTLMRNGNNTTSGGQCRSKVTLQPSPNSGKRQSMTLTNGLPNDKEWTSCLRDFLLYLEVKHVVIFVQESEKSSPRLQRTLIHLASVGFYTRMVLVDGNKKILNLLQTRDKIAFVFITTVSWMKDIFQQVGGNTDINWIIHSKIPEEDLKPLKLRLDSKVFTMSFDDDTFLFKEVYQLSNRNPWIVNVIGVWSSISGLVTTSTNLWERRADLRGAVFRVATADDKPFLGIDKTNHGMTVSGFCYELWKLFETSLNFSSIFVESIDGTWGTLLDDGSFSGMIGMLEKDLADVAVSSITLSSSRTNRTDFLMPYGYFKEVLYYKDGAVSLSWTTFLHPFEKHTWIVVWLTIPICAFVLWITTHFGKDSDFDAALSLLVMIHGFFNQGSPDEPKKPSAKIVFLASFFTGLIIVSFYSANLTSILAVKLQRPPFVSLSDMVDNTDYNILTVAGSLFDQLFKSGDDVYQEIFENRMEYVGSLSDLKETMLDNPGRRAVLWTKVTLDAMFKDDCSYKVSEAFHIVSPLSIYLRQDSPYTKVLNYQFAKLRESGQLQKLNTKWFDSNSFANQQCNAFTLESLGLQNVVSAFVLCIFSFIISLLLLACEMIAVRRQSPLGTSSPTESRPASPPLYRVQASIDIDD